MTKRPRRCHYDRATKRRYVTRRHLDDCPDRTRCDGCQPCEADHCVVCRVRHTDDQHPLVDDHCVGDIREDLNDIRRYCTQLRRQAVDGGNDGRLWAAAPIPGGDAMVMIGPHSDLPAAAARYESWKAGRFKNRDSVWRTYGDDHRPGDPLPPLAVLAEWEDRWRTYLQTPTSKPASIRGAIGFFDQHLTLMAQISDGPDIAAFAHDMHTLGIRLELVLHDEEAPERGVECFECGEQLVRRIRDLQDKPCRHRTPARDRVRSLLKAREAAREQRAGAIAWLQVLASYGLDPTAAERRAAELPRLPSKGELQAARAACSRCNPGGVDDPRPARSWECPGCRKEYTPGEYHHAVRRDLLDNDDGIRWQSVPLAAEAASRLAGRTVSLTTVRKWMDRGVVASRCAWTPGRAWGQREVWWPDVKERVARMAAKDARAS